MIEVEGARAVPFRVLVVSGADVSRGPAVERVLRSHLSRGPAIDAVVLSSAGTGAVVGEGMHPYTARALTEAGVDPRGHGAHRVTERRVALADLVLTADRAQRDAVLALHPGAGDTTFTVLEFARLAARTPSVPENPRDLVAKLAMSRPVTRAASETVAGEDLADTAAGSYRDHEAVVQRVDEAVRDISRALSASMSIPVTGWA